MTARNNKHNSNEQTSASEASGASKRTTYDRNSDLNSGHPEELLPNSRFVWNGVFRPPIGFSGSFSNGGGYRGRVHGDEGQQRAEAEREGCGGAGETSRLKGPSAGQMLMKAIDKESLATSKAALSEAILSQAAPKYSLKTQLWIGGVIAFFMGLGVLLAVEYGY